MDPNQTAPLCKNRFEKFARIFSRRHKQTTFSDAGFLGALRVNMKFWNNFRELTFLSSMNSKFNLSAGDCGRGGGL